MPEHVSFKDVSIAELNAVLEQPAIYSNKIYATVTQAGVRLTFAETRGDEGSVQARSSVLLPFQSAMELLEILHNVMQNVQAIEVPQAPEG